MFCYCLITLQSYEFPGSAGIEKMQSIMSNFHKGLETIAGMKIERTEDYSKELNGLPASDVLKYYYQGARVDGIDGVDDVNGSVVIRPSGTEPKLKAYISVTTSDIHTAEEIERRITADLEKHL